jgi:hypothetical protein
MTTMFADKLRMKEIEDTLAHSPTVHVVVGAGDLAVEKIRAAREEIASRGTTFDAGSLRRQAEATLRDGVAALQAEVQGAPEQLRALPEWAPEWPAKAQELLALILSSAFSAYGELSVRGRGVVEQFRGDHEATPVDEPVKRPTPQARPASPTAKKASARKSTATSTPKKSTATKSTAEKSTAKKSTPQKSTAKKSTATKSTDSSTSS